MATPRGLELQLRVRSRILTTREGEALGIWFKWGPVAFYIIANLPETEDDSTEQPLAYVKVTLSPDEDWSVFREHLGDKADDNGRITSETAGQTSR